MGRLSHVMKDVMKGLYATFSIVEDRAVLLRTQSLLRTPAYPSVGTF